jgi:hypothetical protein
MWSLLGCYRWNLIFACIIQSVAATASVVPSIVVAALPKSLLSPETTTANDLWKWGWIAIAALSVRAVLDLMVACAASAGGSP